MTLWKAFTFFPFHFNHFFLLNFVTNMQPNCDIKYGFVLKGKGGFFHQGDLAQVEGSREGGGVISRDPGGGGTWELWF